jgi:hypothetical protein
MLLKGRTTAELTEREQELFRRIQGVAREYGAIDNVSSSWSVVQVLPKQMGTHTERTAKTLALKVEALEIKRQTYRRLTNCLRELEREIRLPQHEIDIDIDLTIA